MEVYGKANTPTEGRIAIVTDAERDAVDAPALARAGSQGGFP
jgi:hypothetical protein